MVSVDLLLGHVKGEARPDVVVSIVDATNLERHLYLTTQLMDLGLPVVVAVNLIDLAKKHGLAIDFATLEAKLGIPVVPIQANRGIGLEALKGAITRAAESEAVVEGVPFPNRSSARCTALGEVLGGEVETVPSRARTSRRRRVHGKTAHVPIRRRSRSTTWQKRVPASPRPVARSPRSRPEPVTPGFARRSPAASSVPQQRAVTWSDRLDRVFTHKLWGTLIFLRFDVRGLRSDLRRRRADHGPDRLWQGLAFRTASDDAMAPGPLRSLITDGVLKGVGGVLVFLPQIMILFAVIAILEDCGYMARAAFLMDKLMARCGLNGKSFIPLLSSVACAVPGIMATRVIENRRDRLATILVAPLMSCSARLPLYMLLIGTFLSDPWWLPGVVLFGMYMHRLRRRPARRPGTEAHAAAGRNAGLRHGNAGVQDPADPSHRSPHARTPGGRSSTVPGRLILASMVVVWALLYFPHTMPDGRSYDEVTSEMEQSAQRSQRAETRKRSTTSVPPCMENGSDRAASGESDRRWNRYSARSDGTGKLACRPSRVSRPAKSSSGRSGSFTIRATTPTQSLKKRRAAAHRSGARSARSGRRTRPSGAYPVPVALSLLVFFALCCQCASTLAIIRRETRSWAWPAFTFTYMTVLAYIGALVTYQIGRLIVG